MINRTLTIEDLASRLKPLLGKRIDEIYFRYQTAESYEEKNEILGALMTLYQKNLSKLLDKGILIEPPEVTFDGEYNLGKISYAGKDVGEFNLREKDWARHVCVTGMSGSGKTNFAFNVLNHFIEKDKPFLVFDWKKSFRPLMKKNKDVFLFTIGNDAVSNLFKTNINVPPIGVSPKEWINTLCDLLVESFQASFGVHKILLETLDEVFDGWGIYEGGKHYPNWEHVNKMLELKAREAKGRETGWYESALRISKVLTFGDFGKVVNYDGKKSLKVEDLFNKKTIFELNSLGNTEKKFFSEFILTYIYKLRKASESRTENNFDFAVLVDEAHNIFLKKQTNFMNESVTDTIYREMREYGVSLICLDQHISKLSDTVKGNSAVHIMFQQQLPEDIDSVSKIANLYDKKDYFSKLNVGEAIVKLSERVTSPFLVKTPLIDLRLDTLSDEKVESKMNAILTGIDVEKNEPEFRKELEDSEEYNVIGNKHLKEISVIGNKDLDEIHIIGNKNLKEINIGNNKDLDELIVTGNYELDNLNIFNNEDLDYVVIRNNSRKKIKESLTKTQKVLYDFVKEKSESLSLFKIEKLLEEGLHEKLYSVRDIIVVVNKVLEGKLKFEKKVVETSPKEVEEVKETEVILPKEKVEEKKQSIRLKDNSLKESEKKFLEFLLNNPEHDKNTTEVYKLVGLSTRKGNDIKNKLMDKGLIQIEEVRDESGWKKFIRLSNSYLQTLNNFSKLQE